MRDKYYAVLDTNVLVSAILGALTNVKNLFISTLIITITLNLYSLGFPPETSQRTYPRFFYKFQLLHLR